MGGAQLFAGGKSCDKPYSHPVRSTRRARLDWFRSARFGMFIHWGLYSMLGRGEWVLYQEAIPRDEFVKLAEQFNARLHSMRMPGRNWLGGRHALYGADDDAPRWFLPVRQSILGLHVGQDGGETRLRARVCGGGPAPGLGVGCTIR